VAVKRLNLISEEKSVSARSLFNTY